MKFFLPSERQRHDQHYHDPAQAFRALLLEWKERGAEVEGTSNPLCWANAVGDVLLYDRPTLQWLTGRYRVGLFANCEAPTDGRIHSPWIFWPRDPRLMNQFHVLKPLPYTARRFSCAFIGSYENPQQRAHRNFEYWRKACDCFMISGSRGARQPLTHSEYLHVMRQSKFGLCLRGFGPKCQREIECMALGVVPIFTPGVSTEYFNRLRLGVHFLRAETVEEVLALVWSVSKEQWAEMSATGRKWYWENCSASGSFETTKKIVEMYA